MQRIVILKLKMKMILKKNSDMPNEVVGKLDIFLDYESDDSVEEEIRKPCKKRKKQIFLDGR